MRPSASSNHKKIAGIREPLVITKDGDILSGHRRCAGPQAVNRESANETGAKAKTLYLTTKP
jgi:hypothetical protein